MIAMILFNILYPIFLFFFTIFFIKLAIKILPNLKLIDRPSKRSNHQKPTPKGAGLILIPLILASILFYINHQLINAYPWFIFCCFSLVLFFISLIDDIYNLSVMPRLLIQLICVIYLLFYLDNDVNNFLQRFYLNYGIEEPNLFSETFLKFFLVTLWIWLINLFNFMDGMDGITVSQTSSFTVGIIILSLIGKISDDYIYIGLILLSTMIAFFYWNAPPAKIFLGDVGSIPLGFLLSSIIIYNLLEWNNFIPLIILILFHFMDASITLFLRILNKRKIFSAHSEHFYQKKMRNGFSHKEILTKINIINFTLILFSLIYYKIGIVSLVLSIFLISISLFWLTKKKSK